MGLMFYEPPGTMFLSKATPIHPDESAERYREYLKGLLGEPTKVIDVKMFSHVNEGKYTERRDPLFVIDTRGYE